MASLSLKQIEIKKIRLVDDGTPLKAVIDIRLGGVLNIHEIGILDGEKGLRALFPKRMTRFGTGVDLLSFDDDDLVMDWRETMIRAYREEAAKMSAGRSRIVED